MNVKKMLPNSARAELFIDIIQTLETEGQKLCILNGYQDYPEQISSDIDAISDNSLAIPHILSQHKVATVIQILQHEATAFFCVLYRNNGGKPTLVILDVYADYRRNGRVFFQGREFLETCQSFKFFKVPAAKLEFSYYLIKKIAKGSLDETQGQRLSELYLQDVVGCKQQLEQFFSLAETQLVSEAASSGNWDLVRSQINNLRRAMLNRVAREHALRTFQYFCGEFMRWIKRIRQPTGLMVVFLGADGSGKSTVIDRVKQDLALAFRCNQYIHLRPRLGLAVNKNSVPVIDPHGKPSRGWFTSTLKIIYFIFDYIMGYLWKIYPHLVRSTFVIFDRYYHDLLVDPKRYRFGGSVKLAQWLGQLIPQPDLWILLDAPAEVLQARKQEVSFEETARQREAYLEMISNFSNSVIVDASQPLDEVVADVNKAILDVMAKRIQNRLGL